MPAAFASLTIRVSLLWALDDRPFGIAIANPTLVNAPDTRSVYKRVSYAEYTESKFPQYLSGGVTVKTKDGRVLTHREDVNRRNGERALTNADTVAKFMENAGLILPLERASRIRDLVLDMDQLPAAELARGLSAQ